MSSIYDERVSNPQNGNCARDGRTGKLVKLLCRLNTVDSDDIYWIAEDFGDEPFIIVAQSKLLDITYWSD